MKRVIALLLALMMVMAMAGCGDQSATEETPAANAPAADVAPDQTVAEGEPQYGGEAVFYYDGFNTVFDPAMGEQYTYCLWLENLFGMDWGMDDPTQFSFQSNTYTLDSADGQIAKEWTWDADTCDFTVTIRDDIYFQEKAPEYDIFHARNLTAADVKYSYDRVMGTGSGFDETNYVVLDSDWRTRNLGFLDASYNANASNEPAGSDEASAEAAPERDFIEVIDDYTLVFHMASDSETKLSEFIIAQVNITGPEWDELTDEQKLDWHYACGTGPYILTEYVAGNHFTFERNDNYYDYDERHPENKLPYIDKITLQQYGDTTTILSSFFAGNLDYIGQSANLSSAEAQQLKERAAYVEFDYPGMAQGLGLKCNQEPFSDLNVRIAMQKAINMEEVSLYHFDQEELILPSLWDNSLVTWCATDDWTPELLDEYTYDPEGAEALLDAAGYPRGADGTRFTFTVALDPSADMELFQLAKGYFADVGINMEIEVLSDMAAGREVQSGSNAREDSRQFNFMIGGSTDAGFSFQSYATTGFAYCSFADDLYFDELLLATRDATTPAEQAAAAKAADLYFVGQHTVIALSGAATTPEYYSARIGGNQNGEFLSGSHFTKTILPRLWINE
ncbi:MAG: ABC transporter substrate-binding protein [Oscillospiraceae bacterium]